MPSEADQQQQQRPSRQSSSEPARLPPSELSRSSGSSRNGSPQLKKMSTPPITSYFEPRASVVRNIASPRQALSDAATSTVKRESHSTLEIGATTAAGAAPAGGSGGISSSNRHSQTSSLAQLSASSGWSSLSSVTSAITASARHVGNDEEEEEDPVARYRHRDRIDSSDDDTVFLSPVKLGSTLSHARSPIQVRSILAPTFRSVPTVPVTETQTTITIIDSFSESSSSRIPFPPLLLADEVLPQAQQRHAPFDNNVVAQADSVSSTDLNTQHHLYATLESIADGLSWDSKEKEKEAPVDPSGARTFLNAVDTLLQFQVVLPWSSYYTLIEMLFEIPPMFDDISCRIFSALSRLTLQLTTPRGCEQVWQTEQHRDPPHRTPSFQEKNKGVRRALFPHVAVLTKMLQRLKSDHAAPSLNPSDPKHSSKCPGSALFLQFVVSTLHRDASIRSNPQDKSLLHLCLTECNPAERQTLVEEFDAAIFGVCRCQCRPCAQLLMQLLQQVRVVSENTFKQTLERVAKTMASKPGAVAFKEMIEASNVQLAMEIVDAVVRPVFRLEMALNPLLSMPISLDKLLRFYLKIKPLSINPSDSLALEKERMIYLTCLSAAIRALVASPTCSLLTPQGIHKEGKNESLAHFLCADERAPLPLHLSKTWAMGAEHPGALTVIRLAQSFRHVTAYLPPPSPATPKALRRHTSSSLNDVIVID
ncbi:hypothetical protein CAOG_08404 [Capsaspora owczarzaki ATCC 30864]|uniref:Uncharacterized protein n=1 Tax=Capsaspora owczarzaki (strain ATCC 30864) TaxID=595528 RepID=A0A0D2WH23_CAPO3|nr:hypothetical protein CAOG_08404 [Capsaspora owczarzaki ATCC 30864]KJE88830.1 hypothetical protein CAOG_008404 [Capsaspora owczarzaki ATCC 30864]|eukprot:XP_011269975.1 hypothetical protein CAOG_08404 [Capsaspora owczarzaki ATCC 30864]